VQHDGICGLASKSKWIFILKILLTGGDGFTGRHFTSAAEELGHTVTALEANLSDRVGLFGEVATASPDVVVHLAAISFVGHADTNAFYEVNVLGTLNLLESLLQLPVRPSRILLASSANIYGNCTVSPIDESQVPLPVNHYAMSKLSMEYMARNYLDRLPIFFVRPFNYTGVGQADSFLIPKLVKHFKESSASIELGNLDVEREFNDVRFVCDAYLKLILAAVPGDVYNICSGTPVSLSSVIELLQSITHHEIDVRVNPEFVRPNEVHRLCGSPVKLENCIGSINKFRLDETLEWMLKN
jgi:nucleoside-diphosphate-sugar epimerase